MRVLYCAKRQIIHPNTLYWSNVTWYFRTGYFYIGITEANVSISELMVNASGYFNLTDNEVVRELSTDYSIRIYTSGCYFFNKKSKIWSGEGCFVSFIIYFKILLSYVYSRVRAMPIQVTWLYRAVQIRLIAQHKDTNNTEGRRIPSKVEFLHWRDCCSRHYSRLITWKFGNTDHRFAKFFAIWLSWPQQSCIFISSFFLVLQCFL